MEEKKALQIDVILTALEIDKQYLATEIGEDRSNLTKIIAGKRKGLRIRRKLAQVICHKVEALILASNGVDAEQPEAKAA